MPFGAVPEQLCMLEPSKWKARPIMQNDEHGHHILSNWKVKKDVTPPPKQSTISSAGFVKCKGLSIIFHELSFFFHSFVIRYFFCMDLANRQFTFRERWICHSLNSSFIQHISIHGFMTSTMMASSISNFEDENTDHPWVGAYKIQGKGKFQGPIPYTFRSEIWWNAVASALNSLMMIPLCMSILVCIMGNSLRWHLMLFPGPWSCPAWGSTSSEAGEECWCPSCDCAFIANPAKGHQNQE